MVRQHFSLEKSIRVVLCMRNSCNPPCVIIAVAESNSGYIVPLSVSALVMKEEYTNWHAHHNSHGVASKQEAARHITGGAFVASSATLMNPCKPLLQLLQGRLHA